MQETGERQEVLIPVWGPGQCHIRASVLHQTLGGLGQGAYGSPSSAATAGIAPSDIKSSRNQPNMPEVRLCLEKEKKTKHSHAAWAVVCGCSDVGGGWVAGERTTLRLLTWVCKGMVVKGIKSMLGTRLQIRHSINNKYG